MPFSIQRLLKKKYFALVMIMPLIFGMVGEAYNFLIKNRQKSMIVEFNYPGSEKGLNPDGSVFEISNLKSDEVLDRAREYMGSDKYGYDNEFLRSRIFITPKITSQSLDRIISNIQNDKTTAYLSTTFYVYYSQKNKLSKNESTRFMESLAKAYTDYWSEKYSENNDILSYNADSYNFDDTDYTEIYLILNNKVNSMIDYIRAHQKENRAFYSEEEMNLGMALKKLESFRDINLEKFYAMIVQNAISKDNYEYIKRIRYLLESNSLEYSKLKAASECSKKSIEEYDRKISSVAFVPSIDSKNNYYMSRTKTGLDDLAKQSYQDGVSAYRILQSMSEYSNLYNKFSKVTKSSEENRNMADKMVSDLSSELADISKEILKTDNEYLEHKTMDYMSIRLPGNNKRGLHLVVKFGLLGLMLALAIILIDEFFKNRVLENLKVLKSAFSSMYVSGEKRGE
ncbi:MAG: hypothetical protein K5768_02270 [Firmicutes bacterium]|nr:hypothetical protein [Bacillota bacterium]